ncbi:MAG TPA: hypothetical protein VFP23_04050, partial [Solirubrobacterales bacterium]|nr:hypothetical protein [Solirubrobacterales bacterium]
MSGSQATAAPQDRPGCGDERRLRKTKTPGVFKRVNGEGETVGYVAVIRVAGRQRKRSARTYEEARRIKRESETDRDRGELQERATVPFLRYLDEWVERYRGQGRRGFRENTRDEYRRMRGCRANRATARRGISDFRPCAGRGGKESGRAQPSGGRRCRQLRPGSS